MAGARTCPECGTKTDEAVCARDGYRTVIFDAPEPEGDDPLVGQVFEDRFKILELLGQGGYGAVYRATQLGIGRNVAIKLLHTKVGQSLKEIARFQQEARALAALKHAHIVDVYDFGQAVDGAIYMVMEYLHGQTLEDWLRDEGPLTGEETVGVALQIVDALAEAHHAGIIHRDLKPANIFLSSSSRGRTSAKVLDFGIARVSGEAAAGITLTRAGAVIGSPAYMSPEQAMGESVTASTDLYSLGCILFECLTGVRAFERESPTACIVAHCTQPPPPIKRDGVRLHGPLVDLVMQLLEKSHADRPESAEAVGERLATMATSPLLGEPTPSSERPLLVFSSGTTGAQGGFGSGNADTATVGLTAPPIHAGRRRGRAWLWMAIALLVVGGGVAAALVLRPAPEPEHTLATVVDVATPAVEPALDDVAASAAAGTDPKMEPAAAPAAPAAPEAPPAPAVLTVQLESSPRARVRRGGEDLGLTPLELTWLEGDEAPSLTLTARGHQPLEVTLTPDDAAEGQRSVRLQRAVAAATAPDPTPPPTAVAPREEPKQPAPPDKPAVTGPTW